MLLDPRLPLSLMRAPDAVETQPLVQALLGRTEPVLSPLDQRALRACLRLAGAELPLVGLFDPDFYGALGAYKRQHGLPADDRVDLPTMNHVVATAIHAVGGPGKAFHRVRGAIFDVFALPHLAAEAPGLLDLVLELKAGLGRVR